MNLQKPGLTLYGLFIVMALLAAAALLLGVAVSSILLLLLIYAALAYSINFITGMIGYVDFGHVLFMAIGSYALATLVIYCGANPLLGVGLGALLGLVFALGIGLVILRFRGVYFAIATVVLVLFFFQAEDGIRDLTVTGVQTCALPICSRPRQGACWSPISASPASGRAAARPGPGRSSGRRSS